MYYRLCVSVSIFVCVCTWVCACLPVFAFMCLFTSNLKFIVTGLRFVHTIFYHSNKFVYTILHTKNEKLKMRMGLGMGGVERGRKKKKHNEIKKMEN